MTGLLDEIQDNFQLAPESIKRQYTNKNMLELDPIIDGAIQVCIKLTLSFFFKIFHDLLFKYNSL